MAVTWWMPRTGVMYDERILRYAQDGKFNSQPPVAGESHFEQLRWSRVVIQVDDGEHAIIEDLVSNNPFDLAAKAVPFLVAERRPPCSGSAGLKHSEHGPVDFAVACDIGGRLGGRRIENA